jgi:UDP-glucose 4-epimerase
MGKTLHQENILVTGGAGFIGSHLVEHLVSLGARVTVYDLFDHNYGGNKFNLRNVEQDVDIIQGDVCNEKSLRDALHGHTIVYHLAAQLSRVISNKKPRKDLKYNNLGMLNLLKATMDTESVHTIIYTGSQAQYGKNSDDILKVNTRMEPVDIYGANKLACENYLHVFGRRNDVCTNTVRLTNVYGPHSQLENPSYGVINQFIKAVVLDETLTVFKPGTMLRDFVFVEDVVKSLVSCAKVNNDGESYIVGSGDSISIKRLADILVDLSGRGRVKLTDWPDEWSTVKVGDIRVDTSKAEAQLEWSPAWSIRNALKETLRFYRKYSNHYV